MNNTWNEQLESQLAKKFGKPKAKTLATKFKDVFTTSYKDDYSSVRAVDDIPYLELLSEESPLQMDLYKFKEDKTLRLRLFQRGKPTALSDILPILENFGLRTENELRHKVSHKSGDVAWVSDFELTYPAEDLKISAVRDLFHEALYNVCRGVAENDGLNKLVLGASLSWQEIIVFRTYAKYLLQVNFRFSQAYIEKALSSNPLIAQDLIALFKAMNNPEKSKDKTPASIEKNLLTKIEQVSSLDEDRIFRRILDLIKATLRTNYYQNIKFKQNKYLAMKLNSDVIPDLPLPRPLCEIFIYSPRFEGVHLRKEKIARGGLRWSDRPEDFRTEILGLMKAQVVKNSIIVPSGAKGGFVLKQVSILATREQIQQEVLECYKLFISALLDLTDNIKGGKSIPPKYVVCHDEPDPYLVVAADKGTATFSDVANSISKSYDFWLGDAFASGGSAGYDHKKIGITARGAWESIKRHFREFELDVNQEIISVIGIGDMSGDVFGNGMLYSRNIKLVGAFDHRHIFIDPNPDTEASFNERERLFRLPISSWEDYNSKLISKGGGIFKRSLKSIPISSEMRQILDIDDKALAPNELIIAMLKAPVDLLFNGGIGTYVKSYDESAADVGDRTNDYCRVNGRDLRCKVVGEGGNLGFTQLGRIEYAQNGGLICTDFIDNSAGVDCSDHEVNLKILLNYEVYNGKLTEEKRNELLTSLTDAVARAVLNDNKEQALVISYSAFSAAKNIALHTDYIKDLEAEGIINREVDSLPDDKELVDRKASGLGLTRPELATLLAYTKIKLKQEIIKSSLPEDPFFYELLVVSFPFAIREKFKNAMAHHRLKREIIATHLSNELINNMGLTFIYRMRRETGATIEEIIRAYTIASNSFELQELQRIIEFLDFKIPMEEQFVILHNIRKLINLSTRWFLHLDTKPSEVKSMIKHYSNGIKAVEGLIPNLMTGQTKVYLDQLTDRFVQANLPREVAQHIATYRAIYTALNIVEVATLHKVDLERTAKVYFIVGERMNLVWFRDQLANDQREDHWHALTRLVLRDELDRIQQDLSVLILKKDNLKKDVDEVIESWFEKNKEIVESWDKFLVMLHSNPNPEYAMFFIAIRELSRLISKKRLAKYN